MFLNLQHAPSTVARLATNGIPARVIRRRLALGVLVTVVVVTGIGARRAVLHREALSSWASSSSGVLRLTGAAARAWVSERTADLHLIAEAAGRNEVLFTVPSTPRATDGTSGDSAVADARPDSALARALAQFRLANGAQYIRIWIFDAHGRPVRSSSALRPPATVRALTAAALATDSVRLSHVYVGDGGVTSIAFMRRVVAGATSGNAKAGGLRSGPSTAHRVLGVVALVIDPRVALFPALDEGTAVANDQSADRSTALLMARDDSAYEYALNGKGRQVPHAVPWAAVPAFERRALAGAPDSTAHLYAGMVMLAQPVSETRWAVVRRERPSTVFAAADAELVSECAVTAVLAVFGVWLVLFRARIAEAQRAREVAASERRYRLVADNAIDLIARHGTDGRIDYVSPAIMWVLGYDPDEVIGRTLAELSHPDDAAAVTALLGNTRQRGGTSRIEHRLRHALGHDIWMETLARAIEGEDNVAREAEGAEIVTVTRDISTRRAAEAKTREALAYVRAVVESSPVAIVTTDFNARVVQWNGAAERLFGWTAAEIVGQPYPLAPGALWEEMQEMRERTVRLGHLTDIPCRRQHKDGRLVEISMSTGVVYDAEGTPAGNVMLATDLTDRMKLETQLRQAQKLEAVGQLAGGIAHDFNNLLTVVTSYASLLLSDLPEDDPIREDIAEIQGAAKRGAALVGQLLAFSRQQVLKVEPTDVNALVATMRPLLKRVLPARIMLHHVRGEGTAVIAADPGQIEQVLMNLVVNARDAIGDNPGAITITTGREQRSDREDAAVDAAADARGEVVITVHDTGCGIPDHLLNDIFDPFFTTKERGHGTGLGLSTVQGIVVQSGGRITVRSEVGAGTEFEVRFPVCGADPALLDSTPPQASDLPSAAMHAGVILLVEDETRVRRVTTRILERAGYEVIVAADATEALTIYERQAARIDLIVTDMMMPDLTGADLIARIRAGGYDVPALFISGYTTTGPLAATAVDPSRFLQKPFTPTELITKVRDVMARRAGTMTGTWAIPAAAIHSGQ